MGLNLPISSAVDLHLNKLAALCDSGFALAIHIRYTRPTLLYRTYAQGWIDHYSEKGFMLSDPTVHWGLKQSGWMAWADLAQTDPEAVIAAAAAHGLHNGLTYSVGPAASRTILGVTRSTSSFTQDERSEIAATINELHRMTEGFPTLPVGEQASLRGLLQS
jgi:LuxR family transcriptional regulator, quorum-sensing system regulator SdiA